MKWLVEGVVKQFTAPLLQAYELSLQAETHEDKLAAELTIKRLESARELALAEAHDRWSATRIGRLLIVLPFGLWWSAVFFVSIANPNFGWTLSINDIPPRFWDLAVYLIPAILIADVAGKFRK